MLVLWKGGVWRHIILRHHTLMLTTHKVHTFVLYLNRSKEEMNQEMNTLKMQLEVMLKHIDIMFECVIDAVTIQENCTSCTPIIKNMHPQLTSYILAIWKNVARQKAFETAFLFLRKQI